MRVALVGAGGVGAGFGAYLADAGHALVALARGAHLQAMQARGLTVRRAAGERVIAVEASDRAETLGPVDLVLFAVKLWDTETAARQMLPLIGPETMVLVLQNGVDALDLIAPITGRAPLIGGVAQISAVIEAPGIVAHRSPFQRIIAGEPWGPPSARLDRLVATLAAAGIEARASDRIRSELWEKFVFITALSGATALMRAPIGPIRDNPETAAFLADLVAEAIAVAAAEGIDLPADLRARIMTFLGSLPADMTASMCADLMAGRRLELPWLSGRVAEGARRHGLPAPASRAVTAGLALYRDGPPALA